MKGVFQVFGTVTGLLGLALYTLLMVTFFNNNPFQDDTITLLLFTGIPASVSALFSIAAFVGANTFE